MWATEEEQLCLSLRALARRAADNNGFISPDDMRQFLLSGTLSTFLHLHVHRHGQNMYYRC